MKSISDHRDPTGMGLTRYSFLLVLALAALPGCRPSPDSESSEAAAVLGEIAVVSEGSFESRGGQTTSGSFRITSEDGDLRLELSSDFRTSEGPDLHVILSGAGVDDVTGETALGDGEALIVGLLESLSGAQSFDLPDHLALGPIRSVLIHCVEYSHLYGAAPLR